MYKLLWNGGLLATGAAGTVSCFHAYQRKSVLAESDGSNNSIGSDEGLADLELELKQVQVVFRHGARTPLHVLEGFRQVPYNDIIMRPHPLTLFHYERLSAFQKKPIEWSPYERSLRRKNLLSGGSIPGHLTSYGQEQLFGLGLRLREAYGQQLGLSSFDPDQFYAISSNVTRTVESARCVIAGVYGADHLNHYASKNSPVQIYVSEPSNNFLVPDTSSCSLLRKVNHAAMLHFDFVQALKEDREFLERLIDESHDHVQNELTKAQEKFSAALKSYDKRKRSHGSNGGLQRTKSATATAAPMYNEDRQLCNYDKQLYDSIRRRSEVSDQVNHFWHSVISHHPDLGKNMRKEDLKALLHLRDVEVEEFETKFMSGYRFKFHFDPNPYFHNREVCKELHRLPDGSLVSSSDSTNIKWKEGGNQLKLTTEDKAAEKSVNFFSWLTDLNHAYPDPISQWVKEVWRDPLQYYQHVSYKMDHSTTKKLNFVFLYDDMKARVTHGWDFPKELLGFFERTVENGTRIMFYAMTGRHEQERPVVTSLSVGRLLLNMVERAESAIAGTNPQRLCLYSSHDSTLVALYESLGLWENKWPPFSADLRVEVYQDRKSSAVYARVLLQGKPVKLRGQDKELIPWQAFKDAVGPYVINQENFKKTCASDFLEKVAQDVLEHEEGEKQDSKKSQKISSTPAGM